MKFKIYNWFGGFAVFLAVAVLTACSSSDGTTLVVDPEAPVSVVATSSKDVALADDADSVAINAMVTKLDGTAVADGTEVTFTITDPDGTLSAASATTTGGVATVNLTHATIVVGNNQTTVVTCTAGLVSGNVSVKFINQPASVDVFIGFDQAVTNLAALQFVLNNSAGATFTNGTQLISAINNAAADSIVIANFDIATNSNQIALINAAGFNTGTEPIIMVTYDIAPGSGLSTFSPAPSPAIFIATDPGNAPTDPPVTVDNMVITVTYDTEL